MKTTQRLAFVVLATGGAGLFALTSHVAEAAVRKAKPTTTIAAPTTIAVPAVTAPPLPDELIGAKPMTATMVLDPAAITSPGELCYLSGPDPKGVCNRTGIAPVTFTGDISGPGFDAISMFVVPSNGTAGIVGTVGVVNGTIAGCGTGTFVMLFGPSVFGTKNPSGGPFSPGYWRIVSRSSSSPLVNTQAAGLIWLDGPLNGGPVTAHLNGTIKC